MVAFRKQKRAPIGAERALTLRTVDGAPLYTFPGELVDSIRHMETTLLYKGALPSRISMVAALREEGVTYTSLALATTLAYDLAVRVCVVELNWWAPSINLHPVGASNTDSEGGAATPRKSRRSKRRNGTSPTVHDAADSTSGGPTETATPPLSTTGLAAVMVGSSSLDDALIQTAQPNLALLPAGNLSPAQRPAIARGDALKACIEQLSRRFDHILLDIPAILATSDAIALASLGTGCCVVVRQGVTPVHSVRRALDDVKHLPMLGVVLNQSRIALPRWVRALVPQE
jgi:hypothetical protein